MKVVDRIKPMKTLNNKEMCPYQTEMLLMTHMVIWCHVEEQRNLIIGHVITHFIIQITEVVKGVLAR